jgi:hypothetical protein
MSKFINTGIQASNPLSLHPPGNGSIHFSFGRDLPLRLDKDGFTYKGVKIEDAGEAYRAFMEVTGKTHRP